MDGEIVVFSESVVALLNLQGVPDILSPGVQAAGSVRVRLVPRSSLEYIEISEDPDQPAINRAEAWSGGAMQLGDWATGYGQLRLRYAAVQDPFLVSGGRDGVPGAFVLSLRDDLTG